MAKTFYSNLICDNCGKIFSGLFVRAKKTCSKECLSVIRRLRSGRPTGIPHTAEWKSKMGLQRSGYKNHFFGKTHTEKAKQKIAESLMGKKGILSRRWKKDRSQLAVRQERNDSGYKDWRLSVWKRDNYKCKIADSNCAGKIEAHHILSWSEYPELRYSLNNGITLCHAHHPRRRAEEKRLIPTFQELVSVSNV